MSMDTVTFPFKGGYATHICLWKLSFRGFVCLALYHSTWNCFLWPFPPRASPSLPLSPPVGWPNSACGPEVSARHRHDSVHHGAHGRRCAHPAIPLQFTSRRHHRDHRDLPESTIHREQRSTHIPGSHLLDKIDLMVEEKGQERDERKVIANCFLWCYTCSCLCVDLDWVFNNCQKKEKKKVSSSLFPPLVPLNIPALSALFLGLYVKPNFLLVSLDQSRWD